MSQIRRRIRLFGNNLGLAWWAKVDTNEPNVTYWFGPFLTRKNMNDQLGIFLEDLSLEGHRSINHATVRSKREEPYTI